MAQGIQSELSHLIQLKNHARYLVQTWQSAGQHALAGQHRSHIKGRGMDFEEVRHYRAGDDIRLMDWNVTARTGKAHVKVYREEKERPVFLLVDQSSSMFFGSKQAFKSVLAAEVAALLGWKTLLQHDRLSSIILADHHEQYFPPSAREQGLLQLLKTLSEIKPHKPKSKSPEILARGLEKLRQVAKPGACVYIISDFLAFNQHALRHLTRIAQHTQITACMIRDPFELDILPAGNLNITDGSRKLSLNLCQTAIRKKLQQSFNEEMAVLKNIFRQHQIKFCLCTPEDDAALELRRVLR